MSKSITETLSEHVSNALDAFSMGDDLQWDVGSGMGPNGQLIHFVTIVGKSPVLGETIQAGGMVMGAATVRGEDVSTMVQEAIEHIRTERSKKLAEEMPSNNHKELALPGQ